jgi:L-aspartate oxidase
VSRAVDPPRFLVSFEPQSIAHRFTDVLILGSGLAGLRAALAVDPSQSVLVVTKEGVRQSNSSLAQGGIAAVWDPEDRFEFHAEDTRAAGKGLCDDEVVNAVVREGPERVRELIAWGAGFDQVNGSPLLTREGGHTHSRVLHAQGDATGREVIRAILEQVRRRPSIRLLENAFTLDLLTHADRCVGALIYGAGGIQAIWSAETILATGGCGQLYRDSTNPSVATGDGLAAAYRAGAIVQDLEFIQFHPTVLYVAGAARFLISEAARGEGAFLRDKNGYRFAADYHPLAELAPRDSVALAIVRQMAKTQHPCVYLDQSHLDPERVRRRFPGITAACAQFGLDFARDPIPVRPAAHYMVGGVRTDILGRTNLPGLWACGEVAATGLHGANRLASNSLLEALVFGVRAGATAGDAAARQARTFHAVPISHQFHAAAAAELDLADIRNSLQSLMFRSVGIQRDNAGLENARDTIDFWCQYVLAHEFSDPTGWELQNMLTLAGLMTRAALARTESRGTHFRTDYPEPNNSQWRRHVTFRARPFEMAAIPAPSQPPADRPQPVAWRSDEPR